MNSMIEKVGMTLPLMNSPRESMQKGLVTVLMLFILSLSVTSCGTVATLQPVQMVSDIPLLSCPEKTHLKARSTPEYVGKTWKDVLAYVKELQRLNDAQNIDKSAIRSYCEARE